jgi:serine/threonine protein kinase
MSEDWKHWQGRTVGDDFQLTEYLGGSANSAVYLAAAADGAKAAIKLFVDDPANAESHLAQWRIAESLSHPHLLRVFRPGRCELEGNRLLYVVMEYAEENLSQILPHRALAPDEVRQMLPPVLDALDYLHSNQLVHGNVTPGNIMAAGDQLKLSADGLLKSGDIGRVGVYSAPEVAQGVSPASDLWSLGLTLVEVLTQHLPVWDPGAALPQLPDNLPEQFRVVLQHCLVRDANLRAKTSDIRERLKVPVKQAAQTPAATPKQPASVPAHTARSSSKRFVIPAAIAVAVIGAAIAITHLSQSTNEAEKPAPVPTKSSEAQPPAPTPPPAAPGMMSEATEPQPVPQKAEPQRSEQMQVLVSEKPSAAAPKRGAATPVRVDAPIAVSPGKQDRIVNQVLPDIPPKAMSTINGKVRVQVKVHVDRAGNVVGSEFVSAGPSKYFANLTMQAARDWKFSPSDAALRAWNLQFEFRRSGASVVPTQLDR